MNRRHAQGWFQIAIVLVPAFVLGSLLSTAWIRPALAAQETLPEGTKLTALEVEPAVISLPHRYAYSQVIVTGILENRQRIDVTRMVELSAGGDLVSVSPTGLVRPKADGAGTMTLGVGGQSISVPVTVQGLQADYPVSFARDVMPVMAKLGCNSGTCHGSLNGKNGFKLSLRGYDAVSDHRSLTDDISGRRVNRASPDQSLILLKPAGAIPHVGGVLMQPGEPYYELFRAWISSGVKLDQDSPRVSKLELLPANPVVSMPGMTQQMKAIATYSDGVVRDVTLEAFIDSGNTEVAESNKLGLVRAVRRGEAPILARFEGAYTATTLTIMGDRSGYEWTNPPTNNYVDELVHDKLKRVKTLPSELCDDAEFLRRVSLDLTGLPPTVEDLRAFLADTRDTKIKRDEVIDRLVGNSDYVELWTNKWGDLLQVNRKFLGERGAAAFRNWIKQAVATNMPYDKFVYEVLTASGSNVENPPSSYFKVLRTPELAMENTTQLFLAVRFNCNHCHDHPFERWNQGQYFHLAAYFAQVGRKGDPASNGLRAPGNGIDESPMLIEDIFDANSGEVLHGATGKPAAPSFPYAHADLAPETAPRRQQLARWITSKENRYFAKSYVNRLWGYLFGRGIIDPIDDIRAGNPPTNPELLDHLTQDFVDHGFDAQHILRTICKSRTYQASIATNRWNEDDQINFSHAVARRLPAEVLFDSVHRVTGTETHLPGVPAGYRAAQLTDVGLTLPNGFFEVFGRPARESACECERSSGMMLGPVMTLVNGPTIAEAIANNDNTLTKLVASESDDSKLVSEIFMRVLSRPATSAEVTAGVAALHASAAESEELAKQLAAHERELDTKQVAWEAASRSTTEWVVVEPKELKSAVGATLTRQADQSILVTGANGLDTYTIALETDRTKITGIRLEALADSGLPSKGPGRAPNGNFIVSEIRVTAAPKDNPGQQTPVVLQTATADFSQDGYAVAAMLDGNGGTGWAVAPQMGRDHAAVVEMRDDIGFPQGTLLSVSLERKAGDNETSLGKFRLSLTTSPRPTRAPSVPLGIAGILDLAPEKRTDAQKAELSTYYRNLDPRWVQLRDAVASSAAQKANERLIGAQDLAWALINSPAFLFNH